MENQNSVQYCNFGQAIEALKAGKRVAREGWNGKNLFIFMQIPSEIGYDIIPKMQSLPQSVKDEFQRRFEDESSLDPNAVAARGGITYQNQMAIVYPNNSIHGWCPSSSDALANDWCILD
ncbi:MAG: DUF2829 domain-containing protein [Thiolinea sp.]